MWGPVRTFPLMPGKSNNPLSPGWAYRFRSVTDLPIGYPAPPEDLPPAHLEWSTTWKGQRTLSKAANLSRANALSRLQPVLTHSIVNRTRREMEGCEEQIQHSLRHVNKTKQSGVQSRRNELRQTVESKLWRDKTKGGKMRRNRIRQTSAHRALREVRYGHLSEYKKWRKKFCFSVATQNRPLLPRRQSTALRVWP